MTPLEIIALILALVIIIKIIVVSQSPRAWFNFAKKIYSNQQLTKIIFLILAVIVGYYLLQSGITIIQVFAVATFMTLLIGVDFTSYNKEMFEFANKIMKGKNIIRRLWLTVIIWLILSLWVLYEIFA